MNPRIRELAEQAVTRFDKDMDGSMESNEHGRWVPIDDLEKFAELIVRECAQFVEDKFDFIGDEIIVKEKMLEHFGVE